MMKKAFAGYGVQSLNFDTLKVEARDRCELKVSLGYTMSSRAAWATYRALSPKINILSKNNLRTGDVAQLTGCLHSTHETLCSVSSTM